jgi:hypothetical protein
MTAMQRDLGLTRKQAEARLAAERTASALAPKVRRLAGDAYAGSWFDAADGRLTVALTPAALISWRVAVGASGVRATVRRPSAASNQEPA